MALMKTSEKGIELIKHFESFKSEPYKCSAGIPTIGYGTTFYPNGRAVSLEDKPITKSQALEFFKKDLIKFESIVNKYFNQTGYKKLSQDEFDACVSVAYNTGRINWTFAGYLGANKVGKQLIVDNLMKITLAGGKRSAGLRRRRMAEAILMFTGKLDFFVTDGWEKEKKLMAIDYDLYTGQYVYDKIGIDY